MTAVHGLAFPFRDQLFLALFRAQTFRNTEINLRQFNGAVNDSNQLWFDALQIFSLRRLNLNLPDIFTSTMERFL
ncbi:hypothetical protein UMNF18_1656 [Escherichia coli UMNF18]|nr:hypothetical protein UMNF18_1656 [Escherichia coli UMNF18]